MSPTEIDLGDAFRRLGRNKGLLAAFAAVGAIAGAVFTVTVPPVFEAKATIILPAAPGPGSPGIGQALGISLPVGQAAGSLAMFRAILNSQTALRAVAVANGVNPKDLRQATVIDDDPPSNTIAIVSRAASADQATKIVSDYLSQLGTMTTDLSLPVKSRKADSLKRELDAKGVSLEQAEERLEAFMGRARTVPSGGSVETIAASTFGVSAQLTQLELELARVDAARTSDRDTARAAGQDKPIDLPPVAQWKTKIIEVETELNALRATEGPDSPALRAKMRQYDEMKRSMQRDVDAYVRSVERELTHGSAERRQERAGLQRQLNLVRELAKAAPAEATEFQRLSREVQVQTQIVTNLRLLYEQARIDQGDDPNRWEVLDAPRAGADPVNKNYPRNVVFGVFIGLALALPFGLRRAG